MCHCLLHYLYSPGWNWTEVWLKCAQTNSILRPKTAQVHVSKVLFFHHCKLRWSNVLFPSLFLSGIMFFFSSSCCCHTFRRLGAGARRAAAGVPGCGGGAQGPRPQQTSRLPAHAEGGQKPHGTERRRRHGRLRLW